MSEITMSRINCCIGTAGLFFVFLKYSSDSSTGSKYERLSACNLIYIVIFFLEISKGIFPVACLDNQN